MPMHETDGTMSWKELKIWGYSQTQGEFQNLMDFIGGVFLTLKFGI